MKKRVLSLVLTLCMLLGLLPTAALAAPAAETPAEVPAQAAEIPETPPDEAGEAAELSAAAPGFTLRLTGQPYYHDGGKNKGNWGPQTKGLGA